MKSRNRFASIWCRSRFKADSKRALRSACDSHTRSSGKSRRILASQMLTQDTTPDQRKEKTIQIRYDTNGEIHVSSQQRSWIQHMLRKKLGHKSVALFILQHGLPELFDPPLRKNKPSKELLESILEKGMRWHASLLQSLLEHDKGPELAHAQRMSCLELTAWRRAKQQAYLAASEAFYQGKRLCEQRDSNKRSYDEMSATEQATLEDYDTDKLRKRVNEASLRVNRKPFRGSLRLDCQ